MALSSDSHPTEAVPPPTFERALRDGFRVAIIEGPDQGASATSVGSTMTLGSDPTCDLSLSCRAISRFHCEIELGESGAFIRDLGSTNGTRVDGVRIVTAYLRRGAEVEIGRDRLRFELVDEPVGIDLLPNDRFGRIAGRSPAMRAAFAVMARAASTDATVLLCGETGVGKDSAAEAIHAASARAERPFITVDCGSLPIGLAESELFGHAAGAFNGADRDRAGVFEMASSGTIFLDEVGELPPALQPKLLRVLERREVQRLGETRTRPVDVRIIAATHRDLRRDVNHGRFRADLYFRLAVMMVQLPPLRERPEDIALLVQHFIQKYRARLGKSCDGIAPAALARFAAFDFPGNVRELENKVHQAMVVAAGPIIDEDDVALPAARAGRGSVDLSRPFRELKQQVIDAFERQYLTDLLRQHHGNLAQAARAAGMDRKNLWALAVRHGLDRARFKKA